MTPLKVSVAISLINVFLLCSVVIYLSTLPPVIKPIAEVVNPTPTISPTPTFNPKEPTTSTSPKPTPKSVAPTKDPRCLIRVRGQIFDLTQFRNIHSGGNIFICGTDMTSEFNGQHNDSVFNQLQKYSL